MLSSLLKKKSEAAAAPQVPAWHPNFRNYEKLPDIKVVRTAFFINVAAITIALALALYVGQKEWELRTIRTQIAEWDEKIQRDKKVSDQAIAQFKKFQAAEAKVNEVDAFIKARPRFSEIVIRVGETLPPHVAIDTLDLRENGLMLRLSVRGTPDAASGRATAYLEQLRTDEQFSKLFDDFSFVSTPTRNAATNLIAVEFFLRRKGAKQ
jgi:hypothetical protein